MSGTQWEYLPLSINITERWSSKKQVQAMVEFRTELNSYGADGWEMISYQEIQLTGNITGNVKGRILLAVFKRPYPYTGELSG